MAQCDYCHSMILFGGVIDGGLRFCNQTCHSNGLHLLLVDKLPADVVEHHVNLVHQGNCPKCGGPGPVDVHTTHTVWSALVLTSWKSTPEVSCQGCGTKSMLLATASSMILGWWGFPWGLIVTPVQVGRNLYGLASSPDPLTPSPQLQKLIKLHLASQLASGAPSPPSV